MISSLRYAGRNLLRSTRRTALTMSAIVAGVGVYVVGEGFVSGLTENVVSAATDGTVGHVLARPASYPQRPGQYPVDDLLDVSAEARAFLDQHTASWTTRTYFTPLAVAGRNSLRVVGIAYDPARDARVFPRDHWSVRGHMPEPRASEVAVSERVARLLALDLGAPMILESRTQRGAMNALEVNVSAIVRTNNSALDSLGLLLPQAFVARLLATDRPSHLSLKLFDRRDAPRAAAALRPLLGRQARIVTWQDETAGEMRLQALRRRALDLVLAILLLLAAFGISNTVLMSAYERVREIGTLRALGMSEAAVLRLFVLEGFLIGIAGSGLGALGGGALTAYWSTHPLDFSKSWDQIGGQVSASALVYTQLSRSTLCLGVVLGVLVAALAAVLPARMAARMAPADAVRAA